MSVYYLKTHIRKSFSGKVQHSFFFYFVHTPSMHLHVFVFTFRKLRSSLNFHETSFPSFPLPSLNGLSIFAHFTLTLYSINTHFDASTKSAFENIVGKGEIARNEQFLLFPRCFQLNQIIVSPYVHIFDMISFIAAKLEEPKIGI